MRFRRRHLAVASLVMVVPLPLAAQGEEARDTTLSVVAGQVVDHATGAPVADAVIELTPRGAGGAVERRLSDSGGAFRFDDIEPGEYVFTATSLGYRSTEDVLEVAAQSNVSVEVRLTAAAIALQPIIVETTRRLWFMDGFEERRADARRHTGFFTSEEILARHPKYITDVFRSVPGATLVSSMIGADVLRVDGDMGAPRGCIPNVFVNGILAGSDMPYNDIFPPEDIAAVELYSLVHNVPQQFRGPNDCGSLVIWLKAEPAGGPFAATWKRTLIGLAAAVTLLLIAR